MREEAVDTRLRVWLQRFMDSRHFRSRDAALQGGVDAAISVASADYANIQLVDATGERLVMSAHRGFEAPFLDFFASVDARRTACGVALLERRPIVVPDVASSLSFATTAGLPVILAAGIRSVVSTPLLCRDGRPLGVLSVHFRTPPRAPVDASLARLEALADAIGARIEEFGGAAGGAGVV